MKISSKHQLSKEEESLINQVSAYILCDYLVDRDYANKEADSLFYEQFVNLYNKPFDQILEIMVETYQWPNHKPDLLKGILKDYTIILNEQSYTPETISSLNNYLKSIKSKVRIQWAYQGDHCECLVGIAKEEKIDEFTIYDITTQFCSSFRLKIPMVAMINQFDVTLRNPCIDNMMSLKWEPVLFYLENKYNNPYSQLNLAYYLGHYLREKTMKSYLEFNRPLDQIKKDCKHNVLFHELGHAIIQHHVFPQPYGAISECFQIFSPINAVVIMLECFADLAPVHQNKKGTLAHIWSKMEDKPLDISYDLAMYFSDIWFFDTDDKELFGYSEILSLILVNTFVIGPKKSLQMFTQETDSCLMRWVGYVIDLIDEFLNKFLTKEEQGVVLMLQSYEKSVLDTQSIFDKVNEQHKSEISAFLEQKECDLLKKCYSDLGYDDCFSEEKNTRLDNLYAKIITILQTDIG